MLKVTTILATLLHNFVEIIKGDIVVMGEIADLFLIIIETILVLEGNSQGTGYSNGYSGGYSAFPPGPIVYHVSPPVNHHQTAPYGYYVAGPSPTGHLPSQPSPPPSGAVYGPPPGFGPASYSPTTGFGPAIYGQQQQLYSAHGYAQTGSHGQASGQPSHGSAYTVDSNSRDQPTSLPQAFNNVTLKDPEHQNGIWTLEQHHISLRMQVT